jgi:transposase-like protein
MRYTDDQRQAAIDAVREGATYERAGSPFGASRKTVQRWCHESGVRPRMGRPTASTASTGRSDGSQVAQAAETAARALLVLAELARGAA